jgi:serine/threonine protein kinase
LLLYRCAPEALEFHKFSTMGDVWSYGVTLWEMYSGGGTPMLEERVETVQKHYDLLLKNHRLKQPSACPNYAYTVMKQCWTWDSKKRPSFTEALERLEAGRQALEQQQQQQQNSS